MSRRIEVTVPNDWVPPVRKILGDTDKCNLGPGSPKPHMVVELTGVDKTVFLITVPGPAVGPTLEIFRKNGIGVSIGRVILCTLDYMKPDLAKPLYVDAEKEAAEAKKTGPKPPPLKGFQHFQKARKTTEEMYNEISNGAQMTINTWMNLIGASVMAAGGLTSGALVFIVAAMLVSPIMGPILGMTMGYRVADWPLFKTGFLNEMKMALVAYLIGCSFGVILGDVGNTYKWPNSQMMPEGQAFNLIISIIVSAAAGTVLGVSLTATGGNALVGTAISAGLLPPLVNAGMLMAYSCVWADKNVAPMFYEIGYYSILFYFTHVVTIVVVANTVFWLKDVDPRFREGEDSNFSDIPTLVEHKQRLLEQGKEYTEKEKAEFFIEHIKADLKKDVKNLVSGFKEKTEDFAHFVKTGGSMRAPRRGSASRKLFGRQEDEESLLEGQDRHDDGDDHGATVNPLVSGRSHGGKKYSSLDRVDEAEDEVEHDIEMQARPRKLDDYDFPSEKVTKPSSSRGIPVPATSSPKLSKKDEIIEFYRKYNPSKLDSIEDILSKYQGKEDILLDKLYKQYNIPRR